MNALSIPNALTSLPLGAARDSNVVSSLTCPLGPNVAAIVFRHFSILSSGEGSGVGFDDVRLVVEYSWITRTRAPKAMGIDSCLICGILRQALGIIVISSSWHFVFFAKRVSSNGYCRKCKGHKMSIEHRDHNRSK